MYALLEITKNCNLQCAHCMAEAGPGNASASIDDMIKIVDNLPDETSGAMITGGEALTKWDLLEQTVKYVRSTRPAIRHIVLQTNGFWAVNRQKAENAVKKIRKAGIDTIQVSSNKIYHKMAGLSMEARQTLIEMSKRDERIYVPEAEQSPKTFPAGRAWGIESKFWADESNAYCWQLDKYVGVGTKGQVYACWWFIQGSELGDARKEKVKDIISRAKESPVIKKLGSTKGVLELADAAGMSIADIKATEAYRKAGSCGLCSYLFRNGLLKV